MCLDGYRLDRIAIAVWRCWPVAIILHDGQGSQAAKLAMFADSHTRNAPVEIASPDEPKRKKGRRAEILVPDLDLCSE